MPENNCGSCHTTDGWGKISFNHDLTSFKLSGKHSKLVCINCHEEKNVAGKSKFIFASLKPECSGCHRDIHFGQFNSEANGGSGVCANCHGFENWKPVKFDHEKTAFPLKGAHEKVACSGCHKVKETNGNVFINYKLENFKCASCHA